MTSMTNQQISHLIILTADAEITEKKGLRTDKNTATRPPAVTRTDTTTDNTMIGMQDPDEEAMISGVSIANALGVG